MDHSALLDPVPAILAPLHKDRVAKYEVQREQPQHRLIIALKSKGYTNVEIAKLTGFTREHIGALLRQPWARERLLTIIAEEAKDPVAELLRGEVLENLNTLIEIRDSADASFSDRRGAANDLLDRYLGKPTQKVDATVRPSKNLDEVDRELQELEAQERVLLGRPPAPATPSRSD